jgi:hypothetical protein
MIQIKIKQYIFFLLFFISFNSYDKTNLSKSETSNEISPSNDVMLLIEIEKLKSENNFLNEKLIINENNQIKDNFDVNQKVKELKDDIIEIMNIYLFFIGVILALIGAAINFF